MPWMTQKLFAAEVGCTTANVTTGIRRGRIAPEWVKREGRNVLINTAAVADWVATTKAAKAKAKRPSVAPLPPATTQKQPNEEADGMPTLLWGSPPADGDAESVQSELEKARSDHAQTEEVSAEQPRHESERRIAELRARLLEIDLAREEQQLMDADEVRRERFETGRRIRNWLMAMAARVAPDLAVMDEPAAISIFMERQMADALTGLADDLQS